MRLPIIVGISPTLKIRGIIASEDIKKGRVIERCPIIFLKVSEEEFVNKTSLVNYYFEWNKQFSAIVLGYGSLYNHSYSPNAEFTYNYKKKFMVYRAIKQIKKGEEIMINYNGNPRSRKKLDKGLLKKDKTYN